MMKKILFVVMVLLCTQYATFAQTTAVKEKAAAMQQVHDFLKKCGTYYLATVDGDQPRVRPFGTIHIFDGKLYIQTGHKKRVAQQLAKNPKAEICAFNGQQWIRVKTTLLEDKRKEAKQSMLDANPSLKSMYSVDDPNTLVLYMKDTTATISSFSGKDVVLEF
ncbi:MAG: pyridoxamine 5'-phosphate oxidase family protein [Prevotellaceae bacterium]|nr:pyridoxamine 5'-phosphate oxidase family protein [Prevotellaceae bacterium]